MASGVSLGWLLGLLLVVAVFFAVGVADILGQDSFDLLATGAYAHASRLARGLGAALLGLALYLAWHAFAIRRPKLPLPDHAELERVREFYAQHGGGAFAHLSFMADKHLFWGAGQRTLIAYGNVRDRLIALGAPSGEPAAQAQAILDFRRYADSQGCAPVFYEVLEPDLARFHDLGFDLFKLGELALIPLAEFSLIGKRWEDLRQAVNRAAREKLSFRMAVAPFDSALLVALEQVSDAWLADKGVAEKGYSLGRFDPAYLAWGPLALVYREGELIAFANLLPGYGTQGYTGIDLMRHLPDAPRGSMDFLFANVLGWAKEQGHAWFSLGMAPLSNVGTTPYARLNERLAALAFRHGNRFYNYQGVRRYKEKFRPEWVGAYLAYPRGLWVPALLTDIAALVAGGYRRMLLS
ncbi:lysyl-tRNA synthetase (class II) [mine drainage metagenome]|uniref:Lysyl-tRNA synthetase (Class II) n=1 Tax=mine drainage metagenome TaxID=410659 RepID=T1AUU9_9ZZZZ